MVQLFLWQAEAAFSFLCGVLSLAVVLGIFPHVHPNSTAVVFKCAGHQILAADYLMKA